MVTQRRSGWLALSLMVLSSLTADALAAPPLLEFEVVEKLVREEMASDGKDSPGQLIMRPDVERVLGLLKGQGWEVAERKEILESALPENDRLVKRLKTPAGGKFAEQVARYPDGYDRLDRLQRLPDGERILDRLIAGPDGYKLLEYLTQQPGGREMGRMLSDTSQGKNFNRSTGRIYTTEQLLERLKQSHQAAGSPSAKHAR